jgi:hypothetical protein
MLFRQAGACVTEDFISTVAIGDEVILKVDGPLGPRELSGYEVVGVFGDQVELQPYFRFVDTQPNSKYKAGDWFYPDRQTCKVPIEAVKVVGKHVRPEKYHI